MLRLLVLTVSAVAWMGSVSSQNSWTTWMDRDNAGGLCDCEGIYSGDNNGCDKLKLIQTECKVLTGNFSGQTFTNPPPSWVPDVLPTYACTGVGLDCWNRDQPTGTFCQDYAIRYECGPYPPSDETYWTEWYNIDEDPAAWGDLGTYVHTTLRYNHTGCGPWEIVTSECKIVTPNTEYTGRVFTHPVPSWVPNILHVPCDHRGLYCMNHEQGSKPECYDYAVRFQCRGDTNTTAVNKDCPCEDVVQQLMNRVRILEDRITVLEERLLAVEYNNKQLTIKFDILEDRCNQGMGSPTNVIKQRLKFGSMYHHHGGKMYHGGNMHHGG